MDQWRNEQLYVPPLPPTNLRGCHLINIQYDIYVSVINNHLMLVFKDTINQGTYSVSNFRWLELKSIEH